MSRKLLSVSLALVLSLICFGVCSGQQPRAPRPAPGASPPPPTPGAAPQAAIADSVRGSGPLDQNRSGLRDRSQDGFFEITVKSPEHPRMNVEELVRDRELDPVALYRVAAGGYVSFNEADWVDKIDYKVYPSPISDLPQYRRFADMLVDINSKIWVLSNILSKYDLIALRLRNVCDRSRFEDLEQIDTHIQKQLAVYDKLVRLRDLVVHTVFRMSRERACRDQFSDYGKMLDMYTKQLQESVADYDRISRKALNLTQEFTRPTDVRKSSPGDTSGH